MSLLDISHITGSRGLLANIRQQHQGSVAAADDVAKVVERRAKAKAKNVAKKKRRYQRLLDERAAMQSMKQSAPSAVHPVQPSPVEQNLLPQPKTSKAQKRKAIKMAKKAAKRSQSGPDEAYACAPGVEVDGELDDSSWVHQDVDDGAPHPTVSPKQAAKRPKVEEQRKTAAKADRRLESADGADDGDDEESADEELREHGSFVPDRVLEPRDAAAARTSFERRVFFDGLVGRAVE